MRTAGSFVLTLKSTGITHADRKTIIIIDHPNTEPSPRGM